MATDPRLFFGGASLGDLIANAKSAPLQAADYTVNINPAAILKDARFLADARRFYRERDGIEFASDDELVDYFFNDRNWREINTVSIARDVYDAHDMSPEQRERMRKLQTVWGAIPSFWASGGRGMKALKDIVPAVVLDPTNIIPGGVAATAARQAAMQGGKSVLRAAAGGLLKAGAVDAGVNAGVNAAADVGIQARDIEIGLQDSYSPGQTAVAAGAGALLGAGVGALVGGPAAVAGARGGQAMRALLGELGYDDAAIAGMTNKQAVDILSRAQVSPDRQAALDAARAQAEAQATANAQGLLFPTPEAIDPNIAERQAEEAMLPRRSTTDTQAAIRAKLNQVESRLKTMLRDGLDQTQPEEYGVLETQYRELVRLANFERDLPGRLAKIEELAPDKQADARLQLLRDQAAYERITADPTQLDFLDQLAAPAETAPAPTTPGQVPEPAPEAAPEAAPEPAAAAAPEPEAEPVVYTRKSALEALRAAGVDEAVAKKMVAGALKGVKGKEAQSQALANLVGSASGEAELENALIDLLDELGPDLAYDRTMVEAIIDAHPILSKRAAEALAHYDHLMLGDTTLAMADIPESHRRWAEAQVELYRAKLAREQPDLTPTKLAAKLAVFRIGLARRLKPKTSDEIQAEAENKLFKPKPGPTSSRLGKPDFNLGITGRMPAFMKRGEFIGRAPGKAEIGSGQQFDDKGRPINAGRYTLAGAEAEARNRAGPRGDHRRVAPFKITWDGARTTTADGVRVKRGTEVWYDPARNKVYADPANLHAGKVSPEAVAPNTATKPKVVRLRATQKGGEATKTLGADRAGYTLADAMDLARQTGKAVEVEVTAPAAAAHLIGTKTEDGVTIREGDTVFVYQDKFYSSTAALPDIPAEGAPAAAPEPPAPVPEPDPTALAVKAALDAFKQHKDQAKLIADLKAITGGQTTPDQTGAPAPSKTVQVPNKSKQVPSKSQQAPEPVQAQPTPKTTAPGRVLAVQNRADPNIIRVASPKQVAAGAGPETLIGRGNPNDWIVGTVPEGTRTSTARADQFVADGAEPATNAPVVRPPEPTSEGKLPPKWEDVRFTEVTLPDGRKLTVEELYREIARIEAQIWPATAEGVAQTISRLRELYSVLPDTRLPLVSRSEAVASLKTLFFKNDPNTIIAARDMLRRLGGGADEAPIMKAGEPEAFDLAVYHPVTTPRRLRDGTRDPIPDLTNTIVFSKGERGAFPNITIFHHELAHWAYWNILTPSDRLQFWDIVRQNYYNSATGHIYPPNISLSTARQDNIVDLATGGRLPLAVTTPQEFFANQFQQWMAAGGRTPGDDTLWRRVVRIIENLIRRFFDEELIDQDLEPLFAKILPDDVAESRVAIPTAEPATAGGRLIQQTMVGLNKRRVELERALNTLVPKKMEREIFDQARMLAQVASVDGVPETVREAFDTLAAKINQAKLSDDIGQRSLELVGLGNDIVDAVHEAQNVLAGRFKELEGAAPRTPGNPHNLPEAKTNAGDTAAKHLEKVAAYRADLQNAILTGGPGFGDAMRDIASYLDVLKNLKMVKRLWRGSSKPGRLQVGIRDAAELIYGHTGGRPVDGKMEPYHLTEDDEAALYQLAPAIEDIFDKAEAMLTAVYKRTEKIDPATGKAAARNNRTEFFRRKATGQIAKRAERAAEDAKRKAAEVTRTPRNKRVTEPTKPDDKAGDTSLASLSDKQLVNIIRKRGVNSKRGQQIAFEIERRERAKPFEGPAVEVPRDVFVMRRDGLRNALAEALAAGNSERVNQIRTEMARRGGDNRTKPQHSAIRDAVAREIDVNRGIANDDGIPLYAPEKFKELMRRITHRDPRAQYVARTMLYRMLNLTSRTVRAGLEDTNIMTTGELYRLAGLEIPEGANPEGAFFDFRDPAYAQLRSDLRRIAIGLTEGEGTPITVMHEIGHMALRTNAFSDDERAAILQAYRLADDDVKRAILSAPGYKGETEQRLAEEWFVEGWANYLAERVARGDVFGARLDGVDAEMQLQLKGTLETLLDRLIEVVAYIVNGLIGRNDIRQMYRRLTFYGDMLSVGRQADDLSAIYDGRAAIPADLAVDYTNEVLNAAGQGRKARIRAFVANGLGSDGRGGFTIYYHGTPNGEAFNRRRHPDVVLNPSSTGLVGPGIYLTPSFQVADEVYSMNPTVSAIINLAKDKSGGKLTRQQEIILMNAAEQRAEYVSVLKSIRRDIARIESSGRAGSILDELNAAILGDSSNKLAALQQEARFTEGLIAEMDDFLRDFGVEITPLVLPVVVRVTNPFDIRSTMRWSAKDPAISALFQEIAQGDPSILSRLENELLRNANHDSISGEDLYHRVLVDGLAGAYPTENNPEFFAKQDVANALRALGYDGLVSTHANTLNSGITAMHDALVVFESNNVKHINARFFDPDLDGLFKSEIRDNDRPSAAIIQAALESDGPLNPAFSGPMMSALSGAGAGPNTVGLMRKILRRETPGQTELETARKFSPPLQLRTNSRRLRETSNAHTVADWIAPENGAGLIDRHNSELGRKIVPIFTALSKLPGGGGINRWAHSLKWWGRVSQPEAYTNIVRAMRRGDASKLTPQERAVYDQIRIAFRNELTEMRAAGVMVGDVGPNYFPQIWDVEAIKRRPDEFIERMANYFQAEAASDETRSAMPRDEAIRIARNVAERLVDEEGVYIPAKAETNVPQSDHIDYQRLIRLQEDWARKNLDELEGFLIDDLQGALAKYFDASTRRIAFTKRWGVNNHAYKDYAAVAAYGLSAAEKLLSTRKVIDSTQKVFTDDGMYEVTLRHDLMHPLRHAEARAAVREANALVQAGDKAGARRVLMAAQDRVTPVYEKRVEAIVDALADFRGRDRGMAASELKFMDGLMRSLQRKPIDVGTFFEAQLKTSKYLRNFNSVTLLGFTTLTSIPDMALPLIRGGNMKAWLSGLAKYTSDPNYRQAIRNVGVGVESIVHQNLATLYGNAGGRFSNAFFNGTMLTGWTQTQREIAGLVAFETFKAEARRMLENQPRVVNGREVANRAYRKANRFLKRYGLEDFGKPGAPSLENLATLEANPRVRDAINKFVNETIFSPSQDDIPLWAQHPLGAIAFQLKSYPLMMGRLSKYVLQEAKQGNVAPLIYMATIGTGLGATAMTVKDFVQARGGEEGQDHALRDRSLSKIAEAMGYQVSLHGDLDQFLGWYIESFMALGGLGMVAELLYNVAAQTDNGSFGFQRAMSYIFGPTVGTAFSAFNAAGAVTSLINPDDSNAALRSGVRDVAARVPVLGGVRTLREGAVDTIAGEVQERSGGGGGFGSGFGGGFG